MLKAVDAMHKSNFIHRDLKCDNIIYSNTTKVTDFTVSAILDSEDQRLHNSEGTAAFSAPETHIPAPEGYSPRPTDIWSIGVTLYTFIHENVPFYAQSELEMQINAKNNPTEIPDYFTDELKDLMGKMLNKDPMARPTALEALSHNFFK